MAAVMKPSKFPFRANLSTNELPETKLELIKIRQM
jgi:hypothetical protein